ncbi:uncharacterized protein M6B38_322235 [Iris pallida]|uniref:PAR1 protein n=1 Tax=Iris pallida TaxID=29817 RepID=A0AAX6HBQ0_IRIPA|nr:uncharacterized protein M6B38_322235 [Iris pallida]
MINMAPLALLVSFSLLLPSPLAAAGVICEELPQDLCSFAISSSSKRCVLESYQRGGGRTEYQCRTSEVAVERFSDLVETDQCVKSCGVDRESVGISSDALLEPQFAAKLCSPSCYQNCPNIIDLYFNLAAGEGVFLPDLCQAQRSNPRRAMAELLSSGVADAAGPAADDVGESDAPAPMAYP